jgi:hypothetical protein
MVNKICVAFSLSAAFALACGPAFAESVHDYSGRSWSYSNGRSNPNEINFTYKLDVPWDWAHRYPPGFVPPAVPVTVAVPGALRGDTTFTYTFDVPWDWAHRYPPGFLAGPPEPAAASPVVTPSGCRAQEVTVGADKAQTITMLRC